MHLTSELTRIKFYRYPFSTEAFKLLAFKVARTIRLLALSKSYK